MKINLSDIDFSSKHGQALVLNMLEQQQQIINEQAEEIQKLRDELNHLKGEQGKPDIKPQIKKQDISTQNREKVKKEWSKRAKKAGIPIDHVRVSKVNKDLLPTDAQFKGYQTLIQQDIVFRRNNTLFKREVYYSPSLKTTYTAEVPKEYSGYHADGLKAFILTQYHVCNATSNKILTLLKSMETEISAGALSNILLGRKEELTAEKAAIVKAGLAQGYAHADSTGARVHGQNHHAQIICNEQFSSYTTLPQKSTLDILAALQQVGPKENLTLAYSQPAIDLIEDKVGRKHKASLAEIFTLGTILSYREFDRIIAGKAPRLHAMGNLYPKVIEALALAYYQHHQQGFPIVSNLMTDNAPEYNKIALKAHPLCWIHEARHYKKLTPFVDRHKAILEDFLESFWGYYHSLLKFKGSPSVKQADKLYLQFNKIFIPETQYFQLNQRIEKTIDNKQQLLVVLDDPSTPLHNNIAELAARAQIRKRDVSLHTMTPEGTEILDAWMTIVQTAIKLKVDIYAFIKEFINTKTASPSLSDIILSK